MMASVGGSSDHSAIGVLAYRHQTRLLDQVARSTIAQARPIKIGPDLA